MSTSILGRRIHRSLLPLSLTLAALLATSNLACSNEADAPDSASSAAQSASPSSASPGDAHAHGDTPTDSHVLASNRKKGEKAARHPSERPIPSFSARTIAGTQISMRDLLGQRIVLFFFNPSHANAAVVSQGVNRLADEAGQNNFKIVGVGVGSNAGDLGRFVNEQGLDFSVIDDSQGEVAGKLRLKAPLALLGVDADGYMTFGMGGFPSEGDIAAWTETEIRTKMRLSDREQDNDGTLENYPQAPELGVTQMSDGKSLETAELKGRAAIVIFFLHTCPHCHKALEAIKGILDAMPKDAEKPRLVAISVQNAPSAVRKALKELDLDYFDPYLDRGEKAAKRWGVTGGVPVVSVLDPEGQIRHRIQGWSGSRDAAMLRMKVARATGGTVPMLLDPKGYSGNDVCGACHEQEYATWQYTKHATAFDTLVTHAADRRTDCVGCHVVGFEEKGGYDFTQRPAHFEGVGCESCHGRGGPHLSPGFVQKTATPDGGYKAVCGTCHNPEHSLGFDYATFHPQVSHKAIAGLSNTERASLLEGGPKRDLLPTQADYVGSDACQSCHVKEFETWQASPHGHSVATLEAKGKAGEAQCLECHTTAFDQTGGFKPSVPVSEQTDLARVGCESCHGAGGDHIGENARRVGTILSLGDKCDSCVILKVCGTCHDDANDPGFEFKVEERIDAQRHGTVDSAATRAGKSAFHDASHLRDTASTLHLFDESDEPDASHAPIAHVDRDLLRSVFDRRSTEQRALPQHPSSQRPRPDPS